MIRKIIISLVVLIFVDVGAHSYQPPSELIQLPKPKFTGKVSIEETLQQRRSIRTYSNQPLTLSQLSQLLWAAQGITSPRGFRTAPSAGALYPLEIYAVVGNVEGLEAGVYKYLPSPHKLERVKEGNLRGRLCRDALSQSQIREAAVDIVIAAVYQRTMGKYGQRGRQYVHTEVGHVGQNICLQAVALNLGVCPIGAFHDDRVKKTLGLPKDEEPLYILSVGNKRK